MKICSIPFLILIIVSSSLFAQNSADITSQKLDRATTLVLTEQYASAHQTFEAAIPEVGFLPEVICPLVENILSNHVWHRDFASFYLSDLPVAKATTTSSPSIAALYPDRLLKKVIRLHPQDPRAFKLLGDFQLLQLQTEADGENSELEARIHKNYTRAVQLGASDPAVNRWLGNYYAKRHQPRMAKKYYLMNVEQQFEDHETFYHLGEILYTEKKYSQGYNYAIKALQGRENLSSELRFGATRLAGLSLFQIGEHTRFLDYIEECISISPDQHAPYIDLCRYYEEQGADTLIQEQIVTMLMRNPYGDSGYRYFEEFTVKFEEYEFAEQTCEELMKQFEYADQAMGNVYLFRGNLQYHQGNLADATKLWGISRSYLGRDHELSEHIRRKTENVRANDGRVSYH